MGVFKIVAVFILTIKIANSITKIVRQNMPKVTIADTTS
jgi:hypothetical protein